MTRLARKISGILLITVPSVQFGGYFLLRLFSGQENFTPSPLQTSFFRAGHAHAGVLIILSLVMQILADHAELSPKVVWVARLGAPLAAIFMPLGFFLSVTWTPNTPNAWIYSIYLGALFLAASVLALGLGLLKKG